MRAGEGTSPSSPSCCLQGEPMALLCAHMALEDLGPQAPGHHLGLEMLPRAHRQCGIRYRDPARACSLALMIQHF